MGCVRKGEGVLIVIPLVDRRRVIDEVMWILGARVTP